MPAGLIYISLQNVKWSLLFKFLFLLFFCFIVSLSTCICDSWNIGIATKKEQKQKYFQFRAFKLIQTLSLAPDKTTICERISQFIVTRFARLILISCVECYSFRNHIYNVLIIGFLHILYSASWFLNRKMWRDLFTNTIQVGRRYTKWPKMPCVYYQNVRIFEYSNTKSNIVTLITPKM